MLWTRCYKTCHAKYTAKTTTISTFRFLPGLEIHGLHLEIFIFNTRDGIYQRCQSHESSARYGDRAIQPRPTAASKIWTVSGTKHDCSVCQRANAHSRLVCAMRPSIVLCIAKKEAQPLSFSSNNCSCGCIAVGGGKTSSGCPS